MPIYNFKCPECLKEIEILQKHTDDPPVCDHSNTKVYKDKCSMIKQISNTSFSLKGGGWYREGYHKGKNVK